MKKRQALWEWRVEGACWRGYNIGLMWEAIGNVKEVLEQGCDQKETDFLHGIRQSLQSRMC